MWLEIYEKCNLFRGHKDFLNKNLSHVVKKVLIQISNLKAFCNRHVKPFPALNSSTSTWRMRSTDTEWTQGHAAGSCLAVRPPGLKTRKAGAGYKKGRQMGRWGCDGVGKGGKVMMGCTCVCACVCVFGGWGGSFFSFITRTNCKSFYLWSR